MSSLISLNSSSSSSLYASDCSNLLISDLNNAGNLRYISLSLKKFK